MKRILQKSLFRLQTLLLLAVMFVVGGSASWAQEEVTFDFSSSTTRSTITRVNSSGQPVDWTGDIPVGGYMEKDGVRLTVNTVGSYSYSWRQSGTNYCQYYGNEVTTLTAPGNIVSVVFTGASTSDTYAPNNTFYPAGSTSPSSNASYFPVITWTPTADTKSVTFTGAGTNRIGSIVVTYEDDTPYEPIVYTVNVTGSNDANAGVVYKNNTYHDTETISVRNALTNRDLTVADVDGMEGSFEIDGNDINVSYTKSTFFEYTFNVSASSLQVQQGVSVSYYFWSTYSCANPYSGNNMTFTSNDKKIVKIELNGDWMTDGIVADNAFTTHTATQIVWEGSSKTVTFVGKDSNGGRVRTAKIWLEQEAAPVTYHVTITGNPSAASITVDGVTGSYGNGSSFDTTEDITVGKVHATEIDDYKCTVSVVGTDITVTYTEKPKVGDVITFDLTQASPLSDNGVTATYVQNNAKTSAVLSFPGGTPLVITSEDANILSVELQGTGLNYITASPSGLANGTWEGYEKSVSFTGNNFSNSAFITQAIVTLESVGEKTYTVVFDPSDIGGSITIGGNTFTPANNSVTLGKTLDLSKVETVVDPEGWYHEDGDVTFNSGTNTFYVTYHEYDHYAVSVNLAEGRAIFNEGEYANESTINSKGVPTVTAKTVDGYNDNVAVDSENKTVTVTYTAWPTWTVSITKPEDYEGVAVVKVDGVSYDSDDETDEPDSFVRGTLEENDVTATRIPRYNANINIDQEHHTVTVSYTPLPVGEDKFDFAESVSPAQGFIDEWNGSIRINAPAGVTFDYPEGGIEDAFTFKVNGASQTIMGVYCRPEYINIPLYNAPVELGTFTVTIPANTFYGTYMKNGEVKSTTHNEVTLTYTFPYRYTYTQLNEQGQPFYDATKTISVDGDNYGVSNRTVRLNYVLTNENKEDHVDASCTGFDTEVTITPMTRYEDSRTHEVTWNAGNINVKYTKIYQYEDLPYTDATISGSYDNVTINFPNGVKRTGKCSQENITFNGSNVTNAILQEFDGSSSKYYGVYILFSAATESGTFDLVIPKGYYQIGGTNDDPILSNELRIPFEVVADAYTDIESIEKSVNGIAGDELTFENNVVQIINVPTLNTPSNQTVNASLSIIEDGKLKVSFAPQTANGTYILTFGIRCLKFDDGTYNNPFSVTYNVTTPALAVKEGFGWTSFCLDVPFKLAEGYTPWYVSGTEANGVTLTLEEVMPVREENNVTLNVKDGFPAESGEYLTISVENNEFTPGASLNGTGDVTFSTEGTDAYIVAIDMPGHAGSQTFNGTPAAKFEGKTQNVVMNLTASELQNVYVTLDIPGDVIIPAGEGILIEGATGSISYTKLPGATQTSIIENNMLYGALEAKTIENDAENLYYKFSLNKDEDLESLGFYWGSADGHSIQMNANKAYIILPYAADSNYRFLINGFDDETTSIDAVENVEDNAPIFNLQGKRVSRENLTSGVYVQNGKKFIVK